MKGMRKRGKREGRKRRLSQTTWARESEPYKGYSAAPSLPLTTPFSSNSESSGALLLLLLPFLFSFFSSVPGFLAS